MAAPLRLGIAGLGTVGIGVVKIIQRHADLIAARAGRPVTITAVCARDRSKNRDADLSGYAWETDAVALAQRADIDVFVEVMGGSEGAARASTEAALAAGKDVVTANKALLAHHGQALAEMAEAAGLAIRFEAAVAGGIPVIKALTEGLAGNQMRRVMGVMNGTCNYILTRMETAGLPYDHVFEEARQLGYLEADPNLDVGGIDAGHKLSLLASIAFGTRVSFDDVQLEGIGQISIDDIRHAGDLGFRIKLLGVAQVSGRGLEQRMTPCLVPADSPLGQLQGGTNMVVLEGDAVGQIVLRGPGAGEGPTASAVMGDVIDLARGLRLPTFGRPATSLVEAVPAKVAAPAPWYLRMTLLDKPGALAKIATALGEAGISIDRMRQYGHEGGHAPVLIVTHKASRDDISHAISRFGATGVLVGEPVAIRIEEV
ncbi:homoserine dehydrogenase [Rhodobacter sphaeroides]|jgi:homoserine dehydrogenase (EC 1.1.1.3)|uniref:Homoserine dehydrogenase n=1 Tax=Cereibacter sphaeroides (strain ATCC 17023 / DSM 158 / JCM 6121 / CCUG 31486 / LMG 2827 / NBRC 12203 / NCIMB 8253 / ATH 2.4.1.) TaxID=272943 RepID=Q3J0V7_CERS4|nr:homoserine dehydrogenase [Cereibacter sphaeroides]ABA79577.1 homoserine dehydrogenase [Cereibacter sphaeroides 2.4.1]AMJ47867.1 homoserine dehydrogenase [Cereibacter sphaeroides]ANS34576.1 homoserine dehydrogenase [Cereibacter sphaeroides]ATN63624.1 homoserine dehydrogenase [Cereibacter sphaeroides]AXC61791.1 homoserine dehydrogenase [Cereibacter sphaeroides 2.4.1]